MHINSTQLAGLIAFLPAAVAAGAVAATQGRGAAGIRRYWTVIAAIQGVAAVEVVAGLRHRVSAMATDWLKAAGTYSERRPKQLVVLLIVVAIAAIAATLVAARAPTRGLSLACAGTAVLILLFAVETISLHATDGVLYGAAGPMLLIGWLWLACGASVIAASLLSRR